MELDPKWLESIEQRLSNLAQAGVRPLPPTICRTPRRIRDVLEDSYEPKMISFGPYHRGRAHLKAMEMHKWRYLRRFLSRRPDLGLHELLTMMRQLEGLARSCYLDATDELDSNAFVEMMMLDGCFLVELVLKLEDPAPSLADREEGMGDPIFSQRCCLRFLISDMLLLENQLPFFIIKAIWARYCRSNDHDSRLIANLLRMLQVKLPFNSTREPRNFDQVIFNSTPHHLLDLFHSYITPHPKADPTPASEWFPPCRSSDLMMPNARLLKNASVKFRGVVDINIFKMSFEDGWMDLSVLRITDSTESLLRNLMAYEECFPKAGNMISAYMMVMESLIHTADDVAVLKESGILTSLLSKDEEVALLFNKLGKFIAYNDIRNNIHHQVFEYCGKKHRKWRAQLLHDYFGNPWSIISFLAAVALLLLTLLQSIFSILSFSK